MVIKKLAIWVEPVKAFWVSAFGLYVYSLLFAGLLAFCFGRFNVSMTGDDLLSVLSAKLALAPFVWEDSRVGSLTSYLLHPVALLNVYDLFYTEVALKSALTAFLPCALLILFNCRRLAFFLTPLFYLIAYQLNTFTREAVEAGTFYYYFASLSLFFAAQLIMFPGKIMGGAATFYARLFVAFILCMTAYWVNLSLFIFAMPYLFYLAMKDVQDKHFFVANIIAFIPPFLLSRIVEIWSKSYTRIEPSFTMPAVLIEKFFFHWSHAIIVSAILLISCVMALIWSLRNLSNPNFLNGKKERLIYTATLLGLGLYWLAVSQLGYVKINSEACERYLTIWILFAAFLMPLAAWEAVTAAPIFRKRFSDPVKNLAGLAILVNAVFLGLLAVHFEIPKIRVRPVASDLWKVAREEKVDAIIAGRDTIPASYWAVWPVFFHSLAETGSLPNAILPIALRCTAIDTQITAALALHDKFRALCIGGDTQACLRRTTECAFFAFNDHPRVVNRTQFIFDADDGRPSESIPVSTLEFTRASKDDSGNLIPILDLSLPAIMTQAQIHLPKHAEAYTGTFGPWLHMRPGEYRLTVNCVTGDRLKNDEELADLKVLFNEKNLVFKDARFTGAHGLEKQSLVFNVPDFKLFTPRVQFLLTSSGKAELDCDTFRVNPL